MFGTHKVGLGGAIAVLLVSILLPAAAFAQTPPVRAPLRLMTSPLPLNVITKPGQPVTADIRVKNNGTQTENLKVELLKFGASGDTGKPQLQERTGQDIYFNWVSFSETKFTAEPNVWKTIKMSINTPKEAAFGYYFAVLFTRSNPDRPTGGASGVEGGVASLVLLNVDAPGSRREAKVVEITASQKVYEFLPAKMTIKLRNAGNIHVAPAGTMFIKQGSKQVGALNFNAERGNILPGTNRVFEMTWNDGFPKYEETLNSGKTIRVLKWNFGDLQKFRFGKYTANLVAVYDDGQRDVPVEAVVSFWVIPWRILGGLLLVILLVGFGVWALLRFVWKNIRRQAAVVPDEEPDASSLAAAAKRPKKSRRHNSERAEKSERREKTPHELKASSYKEEVKKAKTAEHTTTQEAPEAQRQQSADSVQHKPYKPHHHPKKQQMNGLDTQQSAKAKHRKNKKNRNKNRRRHD